MKKLYLVLLALLVVACKSKPEVSDDSFFASAVRKMPNLSFPVSLVVTEYDPGKKLGTVEMDTAFLSRFLGIKNDNPNYTYYVGGKTYLRDSAVLMVYTTEILGGATPVIENIIVTFDNDGKKKDSFTFPYDICCSSEQDPDAVKKKYVHVLNSDLTFQSTLSEVDKDKETVLLSSIYKISETGKIVKLKAESDVAEVSYDSFEALFPEYKLPADNIQGSEQDFSNYKKLDTLAVQSFLKPKVAHPSIEFYAVGKLSLAKHKLLIYAYEIPGAEKGYTAAAMKPDGRKAADAEFWKSFWLDNPAGLSEIKTSFDRTGSITSRIYRFSTDEPSSTERQNTKPEVHEYKFAEGRYAEKVID